MNNFEFHNARSVKDALDLHANSADAAYVAGGMTLVPSLKLRLATQSDLINLASIEGLDGINSEGDVVSIGAMTRHAVVASDCSIAALRTLAAGIGDRQVRNCGTIGGSIANSDPAADYPAAVVGLGATVETNKRKIDGNEFFIDLFETALEPGELITAVHFPVPKRAAYAKFANPASRYAIVGVMVAETAYGVRVGVTGAGPCAFRATGLEEALNRSIEGTDIDSVSIDDSDFNSDIHASTEYRAHLVKVLTKRAIASLS